MELFVVRALERVLAIVIGGISIYLGYRLFLAVKATGEGSAEVKLPSDVSVMVSRVGPGVFFALFGALIVGASFAFPVRYSDSESLTADQTRTRTTDFSGIGPGPEANAGSSSHAAPLIGPGTASFEAERLRVSGHVAFLNQVAGRLESSLSEQQRPRVRAGFGAVKLQLMRPVWGPDWGEAEAFRLWAEGGAPPLETDQFRAAQRFFWAGSGEGSS